MRKLPILVEQSLGTLRALRAETTDAFERNLNDKLIEAGETLSCKKGCSNCCYHPVLISVLEGVALYRALVRAGKWSSSKAAFRAHAEKTKDLAFGLWFLSMTPCPLLDEKTKQCKAYASRPAVCHVTVSTGDPDNCHPHSLQDSEMLNKQGALAGYHAKQADLTKKLRMSMFLLPLSLATLLGERVALGELDLENADIAVAKEIFA
jgi:Fe-S-cluster containining protein